MQKMRTLTIVLFLLLPLFIVACGDDSDENKTSQNAKTAQKYIEAFWSGDEAEAEKHVCSENRDELLLGIAYEGKPQIKDLKCQDDDGNITCAFNAEDDTGEDIALTMTFGMVDGKVCEMLAATSNGENVPLDEDGQKAEAIPTMAALNIVSGDWRGTAEFGVFMLTINAEGTGVPYISFDFDAYACGGSTLSGKMAVGNLEWQGVPIENREFTFSNPQVTLTGTFGINGREASGEWTMTDCSGQWTALAPLITPTPRVTPTLQPSSTPFQAVATNSTFTPLPDMPTQISILPTAISTMLPALTMPPTSAMPLASSTPIQIPSPSILIEACQNALVEEQLNGTTYLCMSSADGDFIGLDELWLENEENVGDFTITSTANRIALVANGWNLVFSAENINIGVYENATRAPFNELPNSGLSVSGNGRGCNQLKGRFEIYEYVHDAETDTWQFAANFEQQCDGKGFLRGVIRLNSEITP